MSISSSSDSDITYNDYINGFVNGVAEKCGDLIWFVCREKVIYENNIKVGDIDLLYRVSPNILHPLALEDILPTGFAYIQGDKRLFQPGCYIYIELTAKTGTKISTVQDGKTHTTLQEKVTFYNEKVVNCIEENDHHVLFIYNGEDPAQVQTHYQSLDTKFQGNVVHFKCADMVSWADRERADKANLRAEVAEAHARELEQELKELRAAASSTVTAPPPPPVCFAQSESMVSAPFSVGNGSTVVGAATISSQNSFASAFP